MKNIFILLFAVAFFIVLLVSCGGGDENTISATTDENATKDTTSEIVQPTASALYFNSASATVTSGQDFTVDAMIDPDINTLKTVKLNITYDPTVVSLNSITCSSAFPIKLSSTISSPQDGTAGIECAISTSGSDVTTSSSVATFSFHAIAPTIDDSTVTFSSASTAAVGGVEYNMVEHILPSLLVTVNL